MRNEGSKILQMVLYYVIILNVFCNIKYIKR